MDDMTVTLILSEWSDMTYLKTLLIHICILVFWFYSTNQMGLQQIEFLLVFYQSIKTVNIITQA